MFQYVLTTLCWTDVMTHVWVLVVMVVAAQLLESSCNNLPWLIISDGCGLAAQKSVTIPFYELGCDNSALVISGQINPVYRGIYLVQTWPWLAVASSGIQAQAKQLCGAQQICMCEFGLTCQFLRLQHRHENCALGFRRRNFGSWLVPQFPG